MRVSSHSLALFALPGMAIAASLSDFTPRVANLPSTCQSVYTANINGCTGSDFTSGSCSATCISSLQALTAFVQNACSGLNIPGQNVVSAFLAGQGPQDLCPNANSDSSATTSSAISSNAFPSSTAATTTASSTTPSSALSTKMTTSSTITTSSASSASTSVTSTSSTTGLLSENSSTASSSASSTKMSASSTSSAQGHSQTNVNDGSGGGSPFDTAGNLHSAATTWPMSIGYLVSGVALVIFALHR